MAHNRDPLNDDQLNQALTTVEGWRKSGDHIERTYEFGKYAHGLLFASSVGFIAEHMDHHPTIVVEYQKVTVKVSTHEPPGISQMDIDLAKKANAAFDPN